jgi:hypothetical protein
MKTFEWIISKIHSKLGGYTQQQNRNQAKQQTHRSGQDSLGQLFQNQLKDWGLVGDRYPLGRALGQLPRKSISSWVGRRPLVEWTGPKKVIDSSPDGPSNHALSQETVRFSRAWHPRMSGWIRDESARFLGDWLSRFAIS